MNIIDIIADFIFKLGRSEPLKPESNKVIAKRLTKYIDVSCKFRKKKPPSKKHRKKAGDLNLRLKDAVRLNIIFIQEK